jgi:anti-sigma B factor antagonist
MQIDITKAGAITIAALMGEVDGKTAPQAQEHLLPLVRSGCRLLLDMTKVGYMSSAGLRVLLSIRRQVPADGRLVLVGLSEQIQDTMAITGFLDFFTTSKTREEATAILLDEVLS